MFDRQFAPKNAIFQLIVGVVRLENHLPLHDEKEPYPCEVSAQPLC
jgi:hypothetical protein